jgi:N-acetylneuraminic acid mutarotase
MLLSGGAFADGQKARVTSTDRWLSLAPSPLQRTEVGAARIGRFIYVLGGFVPTPSGATTSEVTRYDIDANEWTTVRSMPVGVNHPAVAAYKGSLYVHGGYTGVVTQPIDRLFRYTPATDTWVELKNSGRLRAAHARGRAVRAGRRRRAARLPLSPDLRPGSGPLALRPRNARRARAHRGCCGGQASCT